MSGWPCVGGKVFLDDGRTDKGHCLLVPDHAKVHEREAWGGHGETGIEAVDLTGRNVLSLLLHPRPVRRGRRVTAPGREAAENQGCAKPGQGQNSA